MGFKDPFFEGKVKEHTWACASLLKYSDTLKIGMKNILFEISNRSRYKLSQECLLTLFEIKSIYVEISQTHQFCMYLV